MQKNGNIYQRDILERIRRATVAMMIWSVGERIFKEDFNRRMEMFDSLEGNIALYGAYMINMSVVKGKKIRQNEKKIREVYISNKV